MTNHRIATAAVLSGLALASLLAGCATSQSYSYTPPPLGATWVTAQQNTGSYGSGRREVPSMRGERTWEGKQYITFKNPEQEILADTTGAWHRIVRGDTPISSFDPPANWEYPLEVGKSWKKTFTTMNHASNQKVTSEQSVRVEAFEDLTLPAGTFRTVRVRTSDNLGNDNTTWIAPELGIFVKQKLVRTAKHAAGAGTRETELVSHTIRK